MAPIYDFPRAARAEHGHGAKKVLAGVRFQWADTQNEETPSPSGIRGILWVVQSIDLWLVSRGHLMTPMKYSDRHLAGLSAAPPDRVELIGAGSLGYGTGHSFG